MPPEIQAPGHGVKRQPVSESLLDVALRLADNGLFVFPVGADKRPCWSNEELGVGRGEGGLKMATTDPDRIEFLFAHPRAKGIAMPTGKINNVTVVDVDLGKGKPNAESAKAWLDASRKLLLGATVVRTMSKGLHYWCRYTEGIPSAANVWAKGVDCRNDGGFVVIPPFMGYRFERQIDPDDWGPPPPVPERATVTGKAREARAGEVPQEVLDQIAGIRANAGSWHSDMIRLVAHLVGSGWGDAEILRHVPDWTGNGFTHRETFDEVAVAVAGARAKWDHEKRPKTTEEARLWRMAEDWNSIRPAARRRFLDMINGGGK
jgi:hypothetical protein